MPRQRLEPFERGVYQRQRIELVHDNVIDVDAGARTLRCASGRALTWDRLVIAVGSRPRSIPWPGLDTVKDGVVNFVSMQDLDALERLIPSFTHATVVGGGLIGIELVETLRYHRKPVTFLVREDWYWPVALCRDEAAMVCEHIRGAGVDLQLMTEVAGVQADSAGRVNGVTTSQGQQIATNLLGVCVGVQAALDGMDGWTTPPATGRGVIVDGAFRTSLDGVWAIGDCAELKRADGSTYGETIWYSAKRHGQLVGASSLWNDRVEYTPPTFFNSSKFFEMEYTTVGDVLRLPPSTPTIRLHDARRHVSLRIVHDGNRVLGFNMLGSRWDHERLVAWVEQRRGPEWVVDHLADAQFDVEFGRIPLKRLERSAGTLVEVNA